MNIIEAREQCESGKLVQVDLHRTPENKNRWFLAFSDKKGKKFYLVDQDDQVKTYSSIDGAILVVKKIGFKLSHIHI